MGAGEGIHPELGVKARLTNLVEARPTMAESVTQLTEAMPTYRLKRGLVSQSTARKVQNLHPDIWPASFWRRVVPVFCCCIENLSGPFCVFCNLRCVFQYVLWPECCPLVRVFLESLVAFLWDPRGHFPDHEDLLS